jgi:hypothetical protein
MYKNSPQTHDTAISPTRRPIPCIYSTLPQLGHKHGRLPLPALVVLAIAIPLVVLVLAQRHAADLEQQKRHKRRTRRTQARDQHFTRCAAAPEPEGDLRRRAHKQAGGCDGDARPQRGLAEVIGVARARPQAVCEEILVVLFGLLGGDPGGLLAVGGHFEGEARREEGQAQDVGQVGFRGQGEAEGARRRGEDGERAQRDPGCLGEEGDEEFGRRDADRVEARVGA